MDVVSQKYYEHAPKKENQHLGNWMKRLWGADVHSYTVDTSENSEASYILILLLRPNPPKKLQYSATTVTVFTPDSTTIRKHQK